MPDKPPLLSIRGLRVSASTPEGPLPLLRGVDLSIHPAEIHGLAGESGSGKSTIARAVLRLFASTRIRMEGEVVFEGSPLTGLPPSRLREVRGRRIGYILQEASAALNPYQRIGKQMEEMIRTHLPLSRPQARSKALQSLEGVGLQEAPQLLRAYPHQLSLGMCQRVLIALALTTSPQLLIADEPTASLDAMNSRRIVELLRGLNRRIGLAILFISHDCDLLLDLADSMTLLYGGEVLESGPAAQIARAPQHPYTQVLLASRLSARQGPQPAMQGEPPEPLQLPGGCLFEPCCNEADEICRQRHPELLLNSPGHQVRCHKRLPTFPGGPESRERESVHGPIERS